MIQHVKSAFDKLRNRRNHYMLNQNEEMMVSIYLPLRQESEVLNYVDVLHGREHEYND